jgi:hypothetical protein
MNKMLNPKTVKKQRLNDKKVSKTNDLKNICEALFCLQNENNDNLMAIVNIFFYNHIVITIYFTNFFLNTT